MPIVDMTLEELKVYKGTNPIPKDFHLFWDERVKEANKKEISYRIEKSEIDGFEGIDYYNLWFNGINNEEIYAKYIKPKSQENIPLILQFHGYPGASRGWFEQTSFAGMGCAVIAMDCPGQGGNSIDIGNYKGSTVSGHIILGLRGAPKEMYYTKLFQNTVILYRLAKGLDGIDEERIYSNGASQGGGIALACAALNSEIKRCAALYPFLSDYKRVWDMDLDKIAYEGLQYYSKWFDPTGENHFEIFNKLGYIDIHNLATRIKSKVLLGTGLMDNICPPSTQFAVYNNLNSEKKHLIFPDYSHEEIADFDDELINFFLMEDC